MIVDIGVRCAPEPSPERDWIYEYVDEMKASVRRSAERSLRPICHVNDLAPPSPIQRIYDLRPGHTLVVSRRGVSRRLNSALKESLAPYASVPTPEMARARASIQHTDLAALASRTRVGAKLWEEFYNDPGTTWRDRPKHRIVADPNAQ